MKKRGSQNTNEHPPSEIRCYSCGKVRRAALWHWGLTMSQNPQFADAASGQYLVELHSPQTGKVFQCPSCKTTKFVLDGKLLAAHSKKN